MPPPSPFPCGMTHIYFPHPHFLSKIGGSTERERRVVVCFLLAFCICRVQRWCCLTLPLLEVYSVYRSVQVAVARICGWVFFAHVSVYLYSAEAVIIA
jgi:hypothetical protein